MQTGVFGLARMAGGDIDQGVVQRCWFDKQLPAAGAELGHGSQR